MDVFKSGTRSHWSVLDAMQTVFRDSCYLYSNARTVPIAMVVALEGYPQRYLARS
jgi:hypothetical protein